MKINAVLFKICEIEVGRAMPSLPCSCCITGPISSHLRPIMMLATVLKGTLAIVPKMTLTTVDKDQHNL